MNKMPEIVGCQRNFVNNGFIRVNLENENVSIITHDCDLDKLFPGDTLIADTNYVLYRLIWFMFVF